MKKSTFVGIFSISALITTSFAAGSLMAQNKGKDGNGAALDTAALKTLVSGQVWQVKQTRGPGHDYWSWKSDGSVCLRLGEKTGKCADTGQWKVNGKQLCYELTWWGATYQLKSTCFRVADQGKGRYAWLSDKDLPFHEFRS